jgi:NAD(P)-dependent dehydrogenase (short-subunit alcohol dehydrogenase family)
MWTHNIVDFSGIGKETARELAKKGARIIFACRNVEAATQARGKNLTFKIKINFN